MTRAKPKGQAGGEGRVFRDAHGKGFGDRLRQLKLQYHAERGKALPNHEIAELLKDKLRDGTEYSASAVAGWSKNLYVPDTRVIAALADIFHCNRGWLAFGDKAVAQAPDRVTADRELEERLVALIRRAASPPVEHVTELAEPEHLANPSPAPAPHRRRA